MNFSTNQVRQVYFVDETKAPMVAKESVDKKEIFGLYGVEKENQRRTPIIKKENILWATKAVAADTAIKPIERTLEIKDVVAGQEYIFKVVLITAHTLDAGDRVSLYGAYKAKDGDDAAKVAKELKESFVNNLKYEFAQPVDIKNDGAKVVITEVERPWHRGLGMSRVTPFSVHLLPIVKDGVEDVEWAEITEAKGADIKNGHMIADLEYFALGERGDQYRLLGWPNVIPTEYLVDPEGEYDVYTIHYFDDANTSFKSEKDIQFIVKAGAAFTFGDVEFK